MAHDREVAGIRCTEVLERLSDYVDGDLAAAERARIDLHLAGCDWCERFGGAFAATFGRLRQGLADAAVDPALRARLDAALDEA
ncbi:MAG: anti-sigma factor [Deltaproteobacteria bacterium HGW-Deltaproteobacteria-14]|jgi:anti-sigma factor RsiW|nr:MAG: anti-sigma factor [Deltaproteobacteria bacterium HGW-Deltaproteobacteria-14]